MRPDWRLWEDAVKSVIESWNTFEACEEVPYNSIVEGESVIPLGELFTIKRTGKYKFRQIALGNMLKEGKNYGETFASTVSSDGLRWFCSVAATCGLSRLTHILKVEGMQGIKAFSRKMRNERRLRPDTVLEIKRSVYGIPDAGAGILYVHAITTYQKVWNGTE